MIHRSSGALRRSALLFAASLALTACGGGGGDSTAAAPVTPVTPVNPSAIDYPVSVVAAAGTQGMRYAPASGATLATVTATVASPLLPIGVASVIAEHLDAALPGGRVVCISGHGDSTNVITGINLGVIAESAAVLLDARWSEVDAATAWSATVARGTAWSGWENCGVKPEGLPSPSSKLTPGTDGGYAEDVYDGNPSTTYNVISRRVVPADVAAMLSSAGLNTRDDPLRPLRLNLRAFVDGAGRTIFIETGVPAAGASASVRSFVALYLPA